MRQAPIDAPTSSSDGLPSSHGRKEPVEGYQREAFRTARGRRDARDVTRHKAVRGNVPNGTGAAAQCKGRCVLALRGHRAHRM